MSIAYPLVLESIRSKAVESLVELRTTQPISTDCVSHAPISLGQLSEGCGLDPPTLHTCSWRALFLPAIFDQLMLDQRPDHGCVFFIQNTCDFSHGQMMVEKQIANRERALFLGSKNRVFSGKAKSFATTWKPSRIKWLGIDMLFPFISDKVLVAS